MKFSLLSLSWLGRSFHGPFCKKSTKKAGLGDFKDFKLWDSTFFQFRQAWSDFFREWLTKRKFRLQFKHNETEGWTRCQLSRVISYRMFSMFFFPLFPEDWRQAVSDESSVHHGFFSLFAFIFSYIPRYLRYLLKLNKLTIAFCYLKSVKLEWFADLKCRCMLPA